MALDGTKNLFYGKRWGKTIIFMGYRSHVAEIGGNWLKLAKTVS